jgi:hypothetical protein
LPAASKTGRQNLSVQSNSANGDEEMSTNNLACLPESGPTPALTASSEPSQPKRRKRTWRTFVRDIGLYFALYILISGILIGPLFWVWFSAVYVDGPKWVARLYVPLVLLCEIFPPLGWLVNAWVNWWIL